MLKRLYLKHFKCFEELKLELKPLTVLCGINGMGKSTAIQALLLMRQSSESIAQLAPGRKRKRLILNGDLIHLGSGKDVLYEGAGNDNFEIKIDSGNKTVYVVVNCSSESDLLEIINSLNYESDISTFPSSLFSDNFQYLRAERVGPRVSNEKADFIVRDQRSLGISGEHTGHFMSLYGEEKVACSELTHPNALGNTLKVNVEAWMSEVSPGLQIDYQEHASIDQVSTRYRFLSSNAVSDYFRATNVGFGISFTLPIVVAILSAKPGSLLIIENPEAHLHPRGQRRIGELLALASSCGIQVIVETHSDHLVNGIRIATKDNKIEPEMTSVNFFYRKVMKDQTRNVAVSPKLDSDGRFDNWPEGFFDEWDNALDKLI